MVAPAYIITFFWRNERYEGQFKEADNRRGYVEI